MYELQIFSSNDPVVLQQDVNTFAVANIGWIPISVNVFQKGTLYYYAVVYKIPKT